MIDARAVCIQGAGGPEVLELGTLEVRPPGPSELLVDVAAAGLNRADILQRQGYYPAPHGVPGHVPGLEYAGRVAAVGEGVRSFSEGDAVMGIVAGGGMATRIVVHEREALVVPEGLTLTEAAAIPEVFLTAYDALFRQGGLVLGDRVLVHAVGSGVGTAALQLGNAAGATIVGTSRTADKLERCRELGLEHGVLVQEKQFADSVKTELGQGVDLVLCVVGAAYLTENVRALSTGGTVVVIGLMGGVKGELNLGALLAKRGRLVGSVLRNRPLEEKASLAQAFAQHAASLFESGALRPVIDSVMPMEKISEAHRRMESNETFGKIVMSWD